MDVLRKLFATGADAQLWLFKSYGVDNPARIPAADVDSVLAKLYAMLTKKNMPAEPAPAPPEPEQPGIAMTQGQREQIRKWSTQIYGDRAPDIQTAWLKASGFSSAQSCTYAQAAARILELQRLASTNPTGDDIPF